jgi:hypothetical protein
MTDPDPFFSLPEDSDWNACIGIQGDELNYLDGYIEAALLLAGEIIEKNMYEKRDTLVLPILFNARHAIELLLKFVVNRLAGLGVIAPRHSLDHDIRGYFDHLKTCNLGDESLRLALGKLAPFIASLDQIDEDGQELRYHRNRSDKTSLSKHPLANIETIRDSLKKLSYLIDKIVSRVMSLLEERRTTTYTKYCSRGDLLVIAKLLPARAEWNTPAFDNAKDVVKARFGLTNTQFCKALNVIQTSREMNGILGVETAFAHLSDDQVLQLMEEWKILHPPKEENAEIWVAPANADGLTEYMARKNDIVARLLEKLTSDEIADLEALYSLGRPGAFGEDYEERLTAAKKRQADNTAKHQLIELVQSLGLPRYFEIGARRAGRIELAKKLAAENEARRQRRTNA